MEPHECPQHQARVASGVIRMTSAGGRADAAVGAIDTITMRRSWRGAKLTLRTTDGIEHEAGGLELDHGAAFHRAGDRPGCAPGARPPPGAPAGRGLDEGAAERLWPSALLGAPSERRATRPDRRALRRQLVRTALPPDAAAALALLAPLLVSGGFARGVDEANDRYAEGRLGDAQSQARRVLGRELTDEQAMAVATPGDRHACPGRRRFRQDRGDHRPHRAPRSKRGRRPGTVARPGLQPRRRTGDPRTPASRSRRGGGPDLPCLRLPRHGPGGR